MTRYPAIATCFALAAIGLPVLFLAVPGPAPGQRVETMLVALIMLMVSTLRLTWIIYSGLKPVLATTFWMFLYITSAVVPLAQVRTGLFGYLVGDEYLVHASLIFLLAGLSYESGRFANRSSDQRPNPEYARLISYDRLRWVSAMSLVATAYYIQTVGGVSALLSSRRELLATIEESGLSTSDSQVGSALVATFGTVPIFVCFVLWLVHIIRNRVRTPGAWVWLLFLLAGNVVNNPFANPRYWILTMLIALVFALPSLTSRRFQLLIIGGLFAALVLFPYSDYLFRDATQYRKELVIEPFIDKIATKDFDQLMMTANGIWWVNETGFTLGRQLLGALFFWVPRSVWPDKARDTGVEIGSAMQMSNVNLSSPLPLEFWVDFGWIGLICGFFIIGFYSRSLDWRFAATRDPFRSSTLMVDIVVPLLAGYTFILMRGPLLQSMGRLLVLVLICTLVMGRKVRSDGESEKSHAKSIGPSRRR